MIDLILLLAGFLVLIFGANKLVDASSSLAAKFGIPNIVIGLTIVAFGTSAPEMVVNAIAAINGKTEMVVGNVLGSNIFNVFGILGVCAIIYPLTVKSNTTWYEVPLSMLAALVAFVISADIFLDQSFENLISRSDSMILLLFFAVFLVYNIAVSKGEKPTETTEIKNYSISKSLLFIIIGLAGLIIGGRLIVTSAVSLAELIGISNRVIGLTVISIGTSLPELATSIAAVKKKNVDIAIGNVVGSNIFNIFFVLGISGMIAPIEVDQSSGVDFMTNILASILLFVFIFTGKHRRIDRIEGSVFLLLYICYLVYILVS